MKKVFKGWCENGISGKDIVYYNVYGELETSIFKNKGTRQDCVDMYKWPPRRVTITVEVED